MTMKSKMLALLAVGLVAVGIITVSRSHAGDPRAEDHWSLILEGVGVNDALDTNPDNYVWQLGDVKLTRASGSSRAPKFTVPVYSATNEDWYLNATALSEAVASALALQGKIVAASADQTGYRLVIAK